MGFFDNININNIKIMPMKSIEGIGDFSARSILFDDEDEISLSNEFVNNTIKDYIKSYTIVHIFQAAFFQDPPEHTSEHTSEPITINNIEDDIETNIEKYKQSYKQSDSEGLAISSRDLMKKYWDSILLMNEAFAWINTFIVNKDDYLHNTPHTTLDSEIDNIIENNPPKVKSFKCHKVFPSCAKCVFNQISKTPAANRNNHQSICSKIDCKRHMFKFV